MQNGEISAPDKDTVYRELRVRGIRPRWVREAPGIFNWLFGRGKRWLAIALLVVALIASLLRRGGGGAEVVRQEDKVRVASRGQLYGDPSLIQSYDANHWRTVYTNEGERVLALFARPGSVLALEEPPFTDYAMMRTCVGVTTMTAVVPSPELEKMNQMLEGMKQELLTYLTAGGTVENYVLRLYERQRYERQIFEERQREMDALLMNGPVEKDVVLKRWEMLNDELRSFGLQTIALPTDFFQEM